LFRNQNLDLRLKGVDVGLNASPRDETDAKLTDVLVYLCVHGAVHQWFRLKWLADMGALLAQMPQREREFFHDLAVARGTGAAAGQAILLCHRVLGLSLSPGFLAALQANALFSRLERVALDKVAAPAYEGELHEDVFHLPRGYRTISLPRSLVFLYPLLRLPLWLQRKSVGRRKI
jgi:hypothetical protein